MTELTTEHIDRIWTSLVHFIPEKNKIDAGIDFINALRELGVEDLEIKGVAEFDTKYEEAVNAVYEEEEQDEDDSYNDYYDE